MTDITPNPQPLTPIPQRFGMPAKSISWRWNTPLEADATSAVITYAKGQRGRMTKVEGEWVGYLECPIRMKDGSKVTIRGESLEGHPTIKTCANQIWHKFSKDAYEKNFEFW